MPVRKWWEEDFVAFDTETTDKEIETARIVTSCIAVINGQAELVSSWEILINPGVEISPEATKIHGITNEMAADGQDRMSSLRRIRNALAIQMLAGLPVVAFNGRFDFTILDRECRRYGLKSLGTLLSGAVKPVLDPYVLDKAVDQYRKGSRTLGDMCAHYGVTLENAHTAAADAIAAGMLARKIVQAHKGLQIPLESLHNAQQLWASQQAASLERYLRRMNNNTSIVCERPWPVVPYEEAV